MQRTTNYGLCQYEGSDKTSYLVNYNDDMLKIDTAIKSASDAASSAQSKADTADGKADVNASNISTLNTQINGDSGIAADVAAVQGSVTTIQSLIGNGEPTTTDKTLIGAINEVNANEGSLASLTTTEKGSLVGAINEVNGKHVTGFKAFENSDAVATFSGVLNKVYSDFKTFIEAEGFTQIKIDCVFVNGTSITGYHVPTGAQFRDSLAGGYDLFKVVTDGSHVITEGIYFAASGSTARKLVADNSGNAFTDYSAATNDISSVSVFYEIIK